MTTWTRQDSEALYRVPDWGLGFFGINERGHVEATPDGGSRSHCIDIHDLVAQLVRRGVDAPLLLRFDGIIRARVRALQEAFDRAREEYGYTGAYHPVYPIKVNQDRFVVEGVLAEGARDGLGLEVGSKPELLAVMTLHGRENPLVICNGYKDDDYIELALLSRKIGAETILVIEKDSELERVLDIAERLGIEPCLGVRAKLGHRGSGRWQESGGDRSKFGLTTRQIVNLVECLTGAGKLHCLQLLHFHIGSQVTHIRAFKTALREASRTLAGLHELGVAVRWMDVGGGLGVDYDGSRSDADSSMNYSLQEYANDVVYHLVEICDEIGMAPPILLSESGRALVAHHAVLVTEVLGVSDSTAVGVPAPLAADEAEIVRELAEICEEIDSRSYHESYHDIRELRERAMMMFNVGQLSLTERARVEEFYWRACEEIQRITRRMEEVPADLESLEGDTAATYFLNFSLFQSVPDSWAIRQLFPVMPLQRLDGEPTRQAVLADLTCDSDGRVDRFIGRRGARRTLPLHTPEPDAPYYLAFFLVGAYQEILGDMHNLFGDTNIAHIDLDADGRPRVVQLVRGDRVEDVLKYVDFEERDLVRDLRTRVEDALDGGLLSFEESAGIVKRFEEALHAYTYLSRQPSRAHAASAAGSSTP
ncbi:MAG: biosynthetic arginine decarboxylase [Planctomycetota bacterium]|jgi:arginine decarboxylase|nr:biosynthetic arginine decarboxylase [Planctomycetota bacterium]MDP6761980.1 biosynthetic arginine decarboxylase [Planctomycetota bacterium]MDP6987907.1 biosynthetic arginine decarboxylase [Planctomycetota bacterium]